MKPFYQKEIDKVVFQMKLDKTLGLDGFISRYPQSFWEIIGHDMSTMIFPFLTWVTFITLSVTHICVYFLKNNLKELSRISNQYAFVM